MKKIFLLVIFTTLSTSLFSQSTEECISVKLATKTEIKEAEPCIDKLADYVLSKKLGDPDETAHKARTTILAWMNKTPDYTFVLNTSIMKVCKGENALLFGVYMTSYAKAAISQTEEFSEKAFKTFVLYCKNPDNNVVKTKEVEKMIHAWDFLEYDKYTR